MVTVETAKNEKSKGHYRKKLDNPELHVKWWVWAHAANFWDARTPLIPEAGDTEKLIFKLTQMSQALYNAHHRISHNRLKSYFEDQ